MAGLDADAPHPLAEMLMASSAAGSGGDTPHPTVEMLMPSALPGARVDVPASLRGMIQPAQDELSGGAPPDAVDPTVVVISPAEGTPIGVDSELVVRVYDNVALANVVLYAEFPTLQHAEVVHDGTSFKQPYASQSIRTTNIAGVDYQYNLKRDGGWPGDVTLTAIPVDTSGNITPP